MTIPNSIKYRFSDFTLSNYQRLIQIAKAKGFCFILHRDEFIEERKDVIWRHDVEFSPVTALKMAEIEHDEGVQTTYFWQLHTDYYNTVSPFFLDILVRIHSLGHHIGLHFDSHFWDIESSAELDRFVQVDAMYLDAAIRRKGLNLHIDTFSFHNTNPFILGCDEFKYGGLINVYSSFFRKRYDYCADSTGIWRFDRLEDRILDPSVQHLQVLTHDGMWSERAMSPHSRIMSCIQREADRQKEDYAVNLPKTGNINVGEMVINPSVNEK